MSPSRSLLIAFIIIALFAVPAVAAKPVKPPVPDVGVPTVVDSTGQTVGILALPQNLFFDATRQPTNASLIVVTAGTVRLLTRATTDGFYQQANLLYQSYDCVGDPLLYPTTTEFLPFLFVWGTTGYYGGTGDAQLITSLSVSEDGVCRNWSSPVPATLSPARTVDLSGFTPPFSAR
jgi:hypothetical protein